MTKLVQQKDQVLGIILADVNGDNEPDRITISKRPKDNASSELFISKVEIYTNERIYEDLTTLKELPFRTPVVYATSSGISKKPINCNSNCSYTSAASTIPSKSRDSHLLTIQLKSPEKPMLYSAQLLILRTEAGVEYIPPPQPESYKAWLCPK